VDRSYQWPEGQSPLQELSDPLFGDKGIKVVIKRDDLLRPFGGNKGRKLKYAFEGFVRSGSKGMITLGGPFSNHIHAFSTLCAHFDNAGIALVRGEVDDLSNPVLSYARGCNVTLISLTRKEYAARYTDEFVAHIKAKYPDHYLIPEGGGSEAGLKGCVELGQEIAEGDGVAPNFVFVSAGTGATASGVASALPRHTKVMAISALRERIITNAFNRSISMVGLNEHAEIALNTDYHFGGFARWDKRLINFINGFERRLGIMLDPVYTGKTFFALFDMAENGLIPEGSQVTVIHTGGMPGRAGFNYRFPGLLEDPF